MCTIEQPVEFDGDKPHQFVLSAVDDLGVTLNAALVVMGDKLGLYRALAAAGGPVVRGASDVVRQVVPDAAHGPFGAPGSRSMG